MPRSFGLVSSKGRRCVLSALADLAAGPLEKRSIQDLIELGKASHQERAVQLHETLKVGLARCAMRLSNMPLGFSHATSIRRVSSTYVQNFKQVLDFEEQHGVQALSSEQYHGITNGIFNQHRGTMLDVAKGVFEFNEDLNRLFGPDLELAELRHLQLIQDIEDSLDEFFTNRLTLRLMISHIQALNANKNMNSDGEAMVGVVNVSTHPITILSRAYVATRWMCMRDFQRAPELLVNGTMHDEYVQQKGAPQHFAYVHTHLFYIFLELVKNAARASIERAQLEGLLEDTSSGDQVDIPVLRVTVPEDQGIWDHERSVKLADHGTGMNRRVLGKAFSYFYSSVKARPTIAAEVTDFDRRMPLAGFGFGLPISRVMARYFDGNIDVTRLTGGMGASCCTCPTDPGQSPWQASALHGDALPEDAVTIGKVAEDATAAAARIRRELPAKPAICILGSTSFKHFRTEAMVRSFASALGRMKHGANFVISGLHGVQKTFAENSRREDVFQLLPRGQKTIYPWGTDLHAGATPEERQEVIGLIGDVYITLEGGPGVAKEARLAWQNCAAVIPLMSSGGASGGLFDFPSACFDKPLWASDKQWSLLKNNEDVPVEEVAGAVVDLVEAYLDRTLKAK